MSWSWLSGSLGFILSLFMPQAPKNQVKPAAFDDFEVPTAKAGREIPVLFGTRDITGANVVWYGDLRTKKVKG